MIKKATAAEPMLCIQRAASLRSADAGCLTLARILLVVVVITQQSGRPGLTSTLTRERGLRLAAGCNGGTDGHTHGETHTPHTYTHNQLPKGI